MPDAGFVPDIEAELMYYVHDRLADRPVAGVRSRRIAISARARSSRA